MDDDHDELLQVTDDESSSTDDQDHDHCPSIQTQDDENYVEDNRYPMMNWNYSKCEFIMTKVALIFSTTCLMILLPTYLDSQNIESDAYNLILINSTFSVVCFVLLIVAGKLFFNSYKIETYRMSHKNFQDYCTFSFIYGQWIFNYICC
ncbi:hypothetical protein HHI36_004518 [Cryptolaemus montrouzieri]|uniref:Uncharacterized protein n=1 Tax=Cryptolaemus montrouzieri TaxID=559131 RepID=A0ABD2NS79_9CUCU